MMKLKISAITLMSVLISGAASAEELTVEGSGITRDIACSSNDIGIYGAKNIIKLTGKCDDIVIHGTNHQVTFEEADDVSVSGSDNKVTGGRVKDLSVDVANHEVTATLRSNDNDRAELEVSGAQNVVNVTLESDTKIEVGGVGHKINWSVASGVKDPAISIYGADHEIKKAN